jgi:CHASE3 domain sensor protein
MTLDLDSDQVEDLKRAMLSRLSKQDIKDAAKEAFKELLQEQATAVGWLTIKTAIVAILGVGLMFALWLKGWLKAGGGA